MKPSLPPLNVRSSGVLLHPSSLPGAFGIGDLGPVAVQWIDQLAAAGQTWWQILPLAPSANGDAPYGALSAFAGNPLLISPELLLEEGLLERRDVKSVRTSAVKIDFPAVVNIKTALLHRAWETFKVKKLPGLRAALKVFHRSNGWLTDFTLFMALREKFKQAHWNEWPAALAGRDPDALQTARDELADSVGYHGFVQFLFFRQWSALRRYAAGKGVYIIGDMPIFVAGDSVDVWSAPGQFLLDKTGRPLVVAGVPPDYFCAQGQRWGNPLYNWRVMQGEGFAWWIARVYEMLRQCDVVRIDHFRGMSACWHIPVASPTAEAGKWVKSPGDQLLHAIRKSLGRLPLIAEDLGVITPDVEKLRDDFHLPGMRVLQFGFGEKSDSAFLPHNFIHHCIAYTGTHDNDTTAGWHQSATKKVRDHLLRYDPQASSDPAWTLIRLAWTSVARVAITPAQDVLRLGSSARMNTPGVCHDNWAWRMTTAQLHSKAWSHLKQLTEATGRIIAPVSRR